GASRGGAGAGAARPGAAAAKPELSEDQQLLRALAARGKLPSKTGVRSAPKKVAGGGRLASALASGASTGSAGSVGAGGFRDGGGGAGSGTSVVETVGAGTAGPGTAHSGAGGAGNTTPLAKIEGAGEGTDVKPFDPSMFQKADPALRKDLEAACDALGNQCDFESACVKANAVAKCLALCPSCAARFAALQTEAAQAEGFTGEPPAAGYTCWQAGRCDAWGMPFSGQGGRDDLIVGPDGKTLTRAQLQDAGREAGYRGTFGHGGASCFLAGQCDAYGYPKDLNANQAVAAGEGFQGGTTDQKGFACFKAGRCDAWGLPFSGQNFGNTRADVLGDGKTRGEHQDEARAAGYRGGFGAGGAACFLEGKCDAYGYPK
ncbi:MAG: hypothetical protein HY925_05215, partial [Elusimicrobia bacterium]|nr:hypothetical protein [Elusimicrobiota bacterium]